MHAPVSCCSGVCRVVEALQCGKRARWRTKGAGMCLSQESEGPLLSAVISGITALLQTARCVPLQVDPQTLGVLALHAGFEIRPSTHRKTSGVCFLGSV